MDLEEVCFIGHEWKEIKKCTFKIVILLRFVSAWLMKFNQK